MKSFCHLFMATLVGLTLAACSRPRHEDPGGTGKNPASASASASVTPDAPPSAQEEGPPPPEPSASPPSEGQEEEMPAVGTLERSYHSASEIPDRVEVIYQLGYIGTSEALDALLRIYHSEPDPWIRMQALGMVADSEADLPTKLRIIGAASRVGEAEEIRQEAFSALEMIDDPAAIPVWQGLLADPDEDIRELARERIEELQEQARE